MSAAQQGRKAQGTVSTYFRGGGWSVLLLLVISEQENWGFLCSSDVQRAPRKKQQAGLYLHGRLPCIPASDCTAQSIHQSQRDVAWQCKTVLLVSVWHRDGKNVILLFRCVGSGMSACSKMDFIWDGTFTYFDPKDVLTSKFDFRFQKPKRGNLYHLPNKLCSLFFWSTVYPLLNEILDQYIFYIKKVPFQNS